MIHGPDEYSPEVERRLFMPIPSSYSGRVACVVCGATGIQGGRWQRPHRAGHSPCPDCGRQMILRLDRLPRQHTRCPNRTTT